MQHLNITAFVSAGRLLDLILQRGVVRRYGLVLIGFALSFFATATPAFAKDFKADYIVDYTLNPATSLTHVKQRVTLTNQVANLRASSYSLTLENNGYKNLVAADSQGKLAYTETKNADGSPTITFTFNDRVVGVGNQLKWTIEYDSTTLSQHHGQIWDVSIPRVKEHPSYDIASYNVGLTIPKSVGKEAYVSPAPASRGANDANYLYTFQKNQTLPTGIVAAFGNAQVFKFSLKYHLQNPNLGQASTEIALPPDVPPYQQIIYDHLDPSPISLRTDQDGNTLATYYLKSKQSLDVTFTGWSRIVGEAPNLNSPQTTSALPADLVKTYTAEQKYWETSDPELIKKVHEITNPNKPVAENARAIYQYVTTTLQYNTARINKDLKRMGASAAYRDPHNAVCMEFTDLFVTMSRIAGIPAREIDGYAYTADASNQPIFYPGLGSDILHAWAQVYLPEAGWVPVDPTWGSTTGGVDYFGRVDLNRIAFAIKGSNSQQPYAAGSYKTNDKQDGDVTVSFATDNHAGAGHLELNFDDTSLIAGLGNNIALNVTNSGNVALYHVNLGATVHDPARLSKDSAGDFATILPGQTLTSWLPFHSTSWLNHTDSPLAIHATAQTFDGKPVTRDTTTTLHIAPFFLNAILPVLAAILVVAGALWGAWFALHKLYHHQTANTEPAEPLRPAPKDPAPAKA